MVHEIGKPDPGESVDALVSTLQLSSHRALLASNHPERLQLADYPLPTKSRRAGTVQREKVQPFFPVPLRRAAT